ncbi:hypothetical protein, partial [Streptomyces sp. NPDC002215]|uniref:hypothetical protein n=1 Tax=Streptomyces sp. NPDC002215 TaxID=3154412 RepID=UPI00333259A2
EHRTRARLEGRLLITHQPTRQASTPRPQSRTESIVMTAGAHDNQWAPRCCRRIWGVPRAHARPTG